MSSKLLRGTFILTVGMMLSKVLGLIYVIPFDAIVGEKGGALYTYAYIPYTIFISLATGGLPLAVSKFVSKYNALEEYAVGQRLFKSGLKVMMVSGFLAFILMYAAAPSIASGMINDQAGAFTVEEVTTVMRAVSFALILVPVMSLIRGYFQGHQSMGPTAVSQVIEQIVRIIVLLGGAFVVLEILDGSIVTAISVATFAAFAGAIGGLAILLVYWKRRKPYLDDLIKKDKGTVNVSLTEIYKEILLYSIPFIFVGIAMPLFQLVDSFTFNRAMASIGQAEISDRAYGILNLYAQKLVVIPLTLSTAFAMGLVPTVTKAFVEQKMDTFSVQLNQAFQILLFLTIPVVAGMSLLSAPMYTSFYGYSEIGANVLEAYAPVAVLFALFSVTAAVLQGINQQKFTVLSLLVGLLIKLSFNIPLIKMLQTEGSVYATALGYLAACLINMYVIYYFTGYSYSVVIRRTILMGIFAAVMAAVVAAAEKLLSLGLDFQSQGQAALVIAICGAIGAIVYFALSFKSKLAHRLFGTRIDKIQKKLKLRA
ncbi:polysaccharide biosynthesis protein [Peribacillus saganii]|uniref:Polysaccharide biosynthesis protein n=1 Tax=Peribacillus saganii TaxID=2303992 RepID=A0A372LP15_9BACI|nr:polysaccharide biosynthesis protein [Peribacillus saganii]RFU68713.1 polysaccharide biosynthesis protein [Peribacillus saganii]